MTSLLLPEITVSDAPGDAERQAILKLLVAHNDSKVAPTDPKPLAVLLSHPETGEIVGGLWGKISYDWLYVELLFVPEICRGQDLGTVLLKKAEELAREAGCLGVWLNTFTFQAPGFYEKHGYEQFGILNDRPRGSDFHFLRKRLDRV